MKNLHRMTYHRGRFIIIDLGTRNYSSVLIASTPCVTLSSSHRTIYNTFFTFLQPKVLVDHPFAHTSILPNTIMESRHNNANPIDRLQGIAGVHLPLRDVLPQLRDYHSVEEWHLSVLRFALAIELMEEPVRPTVHVVEENDNDDSDMGEASSMLTLPQPAGPVPNNGTFKRTDPQHSRRAPPNAINGNELAKALVLARGARESIHFISP